MLVFAVIFLVLAGVSGLFGFGGLATSFVEMAQTFFYVFLGFFGAALLAHLLLLAVYVPVLRRRKQKVLERLYNEGEQTA